MFKSNCLSICIIIGVILFISILYILSQKEEDPYITLLKNYAARLDPQFKNIPIYESNEQPQTIGKEYILMCVRNSDGYYIPLPELLYILIHELAHIITPFEDDTHYIDEHKHTILFSDNFNMLLTRAKILQFPVSSKPPRSTICS